MKRLKINIENRKVSEFQSIAKQSMLSVFCLFSFLFEQAFEWDFPLSQLLDVRVDGETARDDEEKKITNDEEKLEAENESFNSMVQLQVSRQYDYNVFLFISATE
jgi:hypothetical protein